MFFFLPYFFLLFSVIITLGITTVATASDDDEEETNKLAFCFLQYWIILDFVVAFSPWLLDWVAIVWDAFEREESGRTAS